MPIEPLIGEMMLWTGRQAPKGWAIANGSKLRIDQYPALFTIIADRFGGDGRTTFALPDMRATAPAIDGMIWLIAVDGHYPNY